MNPEQWRKISELFEAALERPVEERAAFLAHACAGDDETHRRLRAMLAADARDDLLMDRPAYQAVSAPFPSMLGPDDSQSFSGEMIGAYRLTRELARGGMGTVYLAYDTRLGRPAALKLLPSRLINNPERVYRLQREARSASALNHPNIITIYDFGNENGRDYIASEFVEGRTLRDYVGSPRLTLTQILDVAVQVASALDAAHAAGIVHRDIKPENIMLRPDGYAKVLDFGLAKLTDPESGDNEAHTLGIRTDFETRAGILMGTVKYMSPEQVRGQEIDGRSDLFSLGVVLYELITGHHPFRGETSPHTMVAITDADPPPIASYVQGALPALQEIISRVLAKNCEQRYQTARALLTDLETLQAELAATAHIERIEAERAKAIQIGELTATVIADQQLVVTDEDARDKVESAVLLPSYLTWRKLTAALAITILVTAAAYFYFGKGFRSSQPALTDKDTILLADFVNTTGDADFDGPLKQGLMVQLGQSPYLNIFPEERARETLGLMERARDEKITREVGREICQRRGIKVLLVGTIASLGHNYVITLEAVNSQSGEAIAQQQTEAGGKEQVLRALGRAATSMREKLGESLSSIRKFDAPIEQATTASLEAFKDYIAGVELWRKGQYAQSVPALKRAIERDGEFALAYGQLGTSYRDLRNLALGNKYLERAYQLRNRVSERERLEISASFFRHITGELDKRIETTALMTRTYPQDPSGYHIHGNSLMIAGQYEQAADAYRAALRLDADFANSRANLALALIGLNRFDEAQEVIEQGLARRLDSSGFHNRLYLIAFLKGDVQATQRQVEWFAGRPDEYQIREIQARSFAFEGRLREASESFAQAAELAEGRGLLAEKARILANEANLNAIFGLTRLAERRASLVLALVEKESIAPEELQPSLIQQLDSQPLVWTLALSGDATRARSLSDGLARRLSLDTMHSSVWLPLISATLELNRGSTEGTDKAIQLLQPARQYEAALSFRPTWVRGQAYLQAKNGALAAAEFQRIIDHRGWDVLSPLWPLAHLGLARAAILQGDVAKGRKAYEDFFQLWKDADVELPVLIEARREYESTFNLTSQKWQHYRMRQGQSTFRHSNLLQRSLE
ncbi:MAG: protein kinase [Pyrinomonadaceae bacterium]|nr:protein kinase [Pyrinomonadaceae bacterium]